MSYTQFDNLNAGLTNAKRVATLPTDPKTFYGSITTDVGAKEWVGGELIYNTADERLYLQIATSGTTASWKRFADQFATSTTSSTTTTTSSTTSTTSTTSSTSSTTSTTSSTSSTSSSSSTTSTTTTTSSTSSSTTSSSTTTMA